MISYLKVEWGVGHHIIFVACFLLFLFCCCFYFVVLRFGESSDAVCGFCAPLLLVTLGTIFVFSGRVEKQFPKLLLDGGKAAASPKDYAADAIGKVGQNACNFCFAFGYFSGNCPFFLRLC